MNREVHVRFWESVGVRLPRATHLPACLRFGPRGARRHRPVHRFLQRGTASLFAGQEDARRVLLRDAAGDQTGSMSGEHELMSNRQGSTYQTQFLVQTDGATSDRQRDRVHFVGGRDGRRIGDLLEVAARRATPGAAEISSDGGVRHLAARGRREEPDCRSA